MNKKGFTLLELLAVVVVLAIVALISIPIISSVIKKAKEGSAQDSVYGYIDSIEKSVAIGAVDSTKGIKVPSDNVLDMADMDDVIILESVNIKGTKPEYAELTFEKSKVKTAGFCMDGFNFEYVNRKVEKSNTDYCANASVKEINIKNSKITFNGNNGNLILMPGEELDLDIEVISDDDSVTPEIILEPADTTVVTLSDDKITANGLGMATVYVKAGIRYKKIEVNVINNSILGYLEVHNYGETGEYEDSITVNGVTYNAHVYNYKGNQEWADNKTFGDDSDIGTDSTNATKMVIVKVDGDLTIGSGVTVLPKYTNYGGPKGFLLYVTGTLTNNGTIDNSHGAKAAGQAVYLWENSVYTSDDDRFEVVPAAGGAGGSLCTSTGDGVSNAGKPGTGRRTGGGGTGVARGRNSKASAGSAGTSYSGGTGSGSACTENEKSNTSGSGGSNGGAGGAGSKDSTAGCSKVGGVGNATPATVLGTISSSTLQSPTNGTGGLLIIYANNIINNASALITALGHNSGKTSYRLNPSALAGGSSGGGSINIFYKSGYINNNTSANNGISAKGGAMSPGGAGGAGTVTIGSIATGTFVKNS